MSFDIKHEMEKDVLVARMNDYALQHRGVGWDDNPPGIGSGRYPHGSGDNPYQHDGLPSLEDIERLTKQGFTDAEIAEKLNVRGRSGQPSSSKLRDYRNILKRQKRDQECAEILELKEKGWSNQKIADKLGYTSESSIRNIINENERGKKDAAMETAEYIKSYVDKNGMYDVGAGVEEILGVSQTKLNQALTILEIQGYPTYGNRFDQVTNPGKMTTQKIICPPGTQKKDVYDLENIHSFLDDDVDTHLTEGGTKIRKKFEYPSSLDSSRVQINYAEDGGLAKDGLIEIRRGMEDCNIGTNHYAQVRIMVDGTHYLKGMAIYSDDLPDGVDVRFNTNKTKDIPMIAKDGGDSVLKKIKSDPTNPFGALIKEDGGQTYYDDPKGKYTDPVTGKKQSLNVVNIKSEEGDWREWKDSLPSQFLAKQSLSLAQRQLNLAAQDKKDELRDYRELTNPTLKKQLLMEFADNCDSAAVSLAGAALPRQKFQVILPLTTLKDNEVYAPNYRDGEQVALVRFPHESTSQIPILTVNNKNHEGNKYIGKDSKDAIGIGAAAAERMSGADFDGDTVMVIPTNNGYTNIKNKEQHYLLKDYDPKIAYPKREGMKKMTNTQTEMGKISNLITDMTIEKASPRDLALAIRHAMCVIDAEKHELDYKRSEEENEIKRLKQTYQLKENGKSGGATTLISRAGGKVEVDKRQGARRIDPETGEVSWKTVPESELYYTKINKTNKAYKEFTSTPEYKKMTPAQQKAAEWDAVNKGILTTSTKKRFDKSTQMMETNDANKLISKYDTPVEHIYANYANQMKALANTARKEALSAGKIQYSRRAANEYKTEVDELERQLKSAKIQTVRERSAQRMSNVESKAKKEQLKAEGLTDKEIAKEMKKANQRYLVENRAKTGSKRVSIEITDRQWEAIQSGAIPESTLSEIFKHCDSDVLKERATPKRKTEISQWKINKIQQMRNNDYTLEQIAKAVGVSTSTVSKYL